jgi:glutamyl-tRNA(Gln) amidotransferase subunit E
MYDFKFKPFEEMSPEDYARVGFKSGLEIHQQLLTERKLFCRCPAGKYSSEYHAEILRHMRPTLSELGEYDGTALMEFKTKKEIIYRIHHDTVCTYEMDDTPPFMINEQALDITIEVGLLMDCKIIDEIHIARKQYLDGSIPTGFQRTAIICLDGKIPYKDREINIIQMSIEEDSCREASDFGHRRIYLTDRLGMPLIETVTAPEMLTPIEVAEVNEILRRIARASGKVRTGVGAAREDVNVSVTGGTRIEIKGVPSIKRIPLLTYNEAMRQWNLLRLREELHKRGITPDSFKANTEDVTKLLKKTSYQPIYNAIAEDKCVKCVTLKNFKDLLSWQTQTDTYFAKEISDRVRVIACLTTLPNIIHSDSHENTIASSDWQKLRKTVGGNDNDTLVIVWGNETDSDTGAKEIIIRAKEATIGIPSETRQALRDGTNGFERILPGPDRMYPDTDLPPKRLFKERIDKIRLNISDKLWEREKWYNELGLPEDVIKPLEISEFSYLFKKLVNEFKIEPVLASVALIQFPKRLKKEGYNIELLNSSSLEQIFIALKNKKILKESVFYVMKNLLKADGFYSDEILINPAESQEIEVGVKAAISAFKTKKIYHPDKVKEIIFGIAMNNLRGKATKGQVVNKIDEVNKGGEIICQ